MEKNIQVEYPKNQFEQLIMEYLPVSREDIESMQGTMKKKEHMIDAIGMILIMSLIFWELLSRCVNLQTDVR